MTTSIGIIDSGLGGFTIYQALKTRFPQASFVFVADQKNSPYGDKTKEELLVIGRRLLDFFLEKNIMEVLFACNTLSSMVLEQLRQEYPMMTLHGVIELTVSKVSSKAKKVLVLGTQATISQHVYSKLITEKNKNAWVEEIATPKLVPLIEGMADDIDVDEVLEGYLRKKSGVDTMVLGCTHYPLLERNIKKFTDARIVNSIDGSIELIESLESIPTGKCRVFTTLNQERFQEQIRKIFDVNEEVELIDLEESV